MEQGSLINPLASTAQKITSKNHIDEQTRMMENLFLLGWWLISDPYMECITISEPSHMFYQFCGVAVSAVSRFRNTSLMCVPCRSIPFVFPSTSTFPFPTINEVMADCVNGSGGWCISRLQRQQSS